MLHEWENKVSMSGNRMHSLSSTCGGRRTNKKSLLNDRLHINRSLIGHFVREEMCIGIKFGRFSSSQPAKVSRPNDIGVQLGLWTAWREKKVQLPVCL